MKKMLIDLMGMGLCVYTFGYYKLCICYNNNGYFGMYLFTLTDFKIPLLEMHTSFKEGYHFLPESHYCTVLNSLNCSTHGTSYPRSALLVFNVT